MQLLAVIQLLLVGAVLAEAVSPLSHQLSETACVNHLCRCNSNTVTCSCAGKIQQLVGLGNLTYPDEMKIFRIENCRTVSVHGDTFKGLKNLAKIEIAHVETLDVDEKGFKWDARFNPSDPVKGIIVNLTDVTVEELPASAFSGNLDAVIMTDVRVKTMRTFAFTDVWKIGRIEMKRFEIMLMEASVAKKMEVQTFTMSDGVIRGPVPTRAFTDIEVGTEFILEKVRFDVIQSRAFSLKTRKMFRMRGCTVNQLRGDAFVLNVHENVIFEHNVFGAMDSHALAKITPDRPPPHFPTHHGVTFTFYNNTIGDFQDAALEIQGGFQQVRIERVVLQRFCACSELDHWRRRLVSAIPAGVPQSNALESSALWCHVESLQRVKRPTPIEDFFKHACVDTGWDLPAVLITVALVTGSLLCVIGVGTVCCRRYRQRRLKDKASVEETPLKKLASFKRTPGDGASHGAGNGADGRLSFHEESHPLKMIIPDGRTYRETELHVIVERAESLPDETLEAEDVAPLPVDKARRQS